MSGFLLDINIIYELVKPKPEANVTEWIENTDESLLYLSVLTLGEIRQGIAALPQSRRRATLEAWLDKDLRARFENRILAIDQEVVIAGAINGRRAQQWNSVAGHRWPFGSYCLGTQSDVGY